MSRVIDCFRTAWKARPKILKHERSDRKKLRDAGQPLEIDRTKNSTAGTAHLEVSRSLEIPRDTAPNHTVHKSGHRASQREKSVPDLAFRKDAEIQPPQEQPKVSASIDEVQKRSEADDARQKELPSTMYLVSGLNASDRTQQGSPTQQQELAGASHTDDSMDQEHLKQPPINSEDVPKIQVGRSATFPPEAVDSQPRQGSHSQLHLRVPSYSRQPTAGSSPKSPAPSISEGKTMDEILPLSIHVDVRMDWEGELFIAELEYPEFAWTLGDNYKELLPDKILEKHQEADTGLRKKEIYHRHGTCRVKASGGINYDTKYAILDDARADALSQEAKKHICGFIYNHPFQEFSLEVYWDSCAAQLEPLNPGDEGYSARTYFKDLIRNEIRRKMRMNFRKQSYISLRDLTVFERYQVVKDLIFRDPSLMDAKADDNAKKLLVNKIIQLPAMDLMMICIHKGIDLSFLEHLIDAHHCTDKAPPSQNIRCEHEDTCQGSVSEILQVLPAFSARYVNRDYQHHDLASDVVMPLLLTGPKENPKEMLGDGAASEVYKIKIDSAHHYLSGDPRCQFALKQFYSHKTQAFEKEIEMLKVLANYPDEHIVLHLTSWTQEGTHYILYPLAAHNLRGFMLNRSPPTLRGSVVLWFLRQLEGLAKAIHHVHYLKFPSNTDPNPETESLQGCHHDIKPENILVFEKEPTYHPIFKISDFGVGMFNQPNPKGVSRATDEAKGTLTYFAPDKAMPPHRVSRPFDMWALGCVYLELMRWLFDLNWSDTGKGFTTQRLEYGKAAADNVRDDMFWTKTSGPGGDIYDLRQPVKETLDELEHKVCKGMRAFLNVVEAIRGLLTIDPEQRWTAKKLMPFLTRTVRQTKTDLEHEQEYYEAKHDENRGRGATSQKLPSERLDPDVSVAGGSTRSPSVGGYDSDSPDEKGQPRQRADTRASQVVVHTGSGTDPMSPISNGTDDDFHQTTAEQSHDPLAREIARLS